MPICYFLSVFTSLISLAQMLKLHCSLVQLSAGGIDVMQPMLSTHTHILLFGSKFCILAMYVQMLDNHNIENIEKNLIFSMFLIFSKISRYFPP